MKRCFRPFTAILLTLVLLVSGCSPQPDGTSGNSPEAPETSASAASAEAETKAPQPAAREGVPTDGAGWYLWDESNHVTREGRGDTGEVGMVATAKYEASAIREKAEKDIALEKKRAMNEMKDDVYRIAMEIAEKLMAREISPEDQNAFVDEFIRKIGEET